MHSIALNSRANSSKSPPHSSHTNRRYAAAAATTTPLTHFMASPPTSELYQQQFSQSKSIVSTNSDAHEIETIILQHTRQRQMQQQQQQLQQQQRQHQSQLQQQQQQVSSPSEKNQQQQLPSREMETSFWSADTEIAVDLNDYVDADEVPNYDHVHIQQQALNSIVQQAKITISTSTSFARSSQTSPYRYLSPFDRSPQNKQSPINSPKVKPAATSASSTIATTTSPQPHHNYPQQQQQQQQHQQQQPQSPKNHTIQQKQQRQQNAQQYHNPNSYALQQDRLTSERSVTKRRFSTSKSSNDRTGYVKVIPNSTSSSNTSTNNTITQMNHPSKINNNNTSYGSHHTNNNNSTNNNITMNTKKRLSTTISATMATREKEAKLTTENNNDSLQPKEVVLDLRMPTRLSTLFSKVKSVSQHSTKNPSRTNLPADQTNATTTTIVHQEREKEKEDATTPIPPRKGFHPQIFQQHQQYLQSPQQQEKQQQQHLKNGRNMNNSNNNKETELQKIVSLVMRQKQTSTATTNQQQQQQQHHPLVMEGKQDTIQNHRKMVLYDGIRVKSAERAEGAGALSAAPSGRRVEVNIELSKRRKLVVHEELMRPKTTGKTTIRVIQQAADVHVNNYLGANLHTNGNNGNAKTSSGGGSHVSEALEKMFDPNGSMKSYSIEADLGKGSYATVKLAVNKLNGARVAMKVYSKATLTDPTRLRNVKREISILSRVSHRNIIKMHSAFQDATSIVVVMEYMSKTCLSTYIKKRADRQVSEEDARYLMRQLVSGLEYLHARDVVHRDIKLDNILVDETTRTVKLIDFGFSVCTNQRMKIFCGTPTYMAPEIVSKQEYCGKKADVWALGIVLYVLIAGGGGRFPFRGTSDAELFKKIRSASYEVPVNVSKQSLDLLAKIIQVNPEKRPSCKEILQHPWFN